MTEQAPSLHARLEHARRVVAQQRELVRALRRQGREVEAAASARSDHAFARLLQAQGHGEVEPPVPPHLPSWLAGGPAT